MSKANGGNPGKPNRNYHIVNCKVCAHEDKEEIERRYMAFESAPSIARDYKPLTHNSITRHAAYFNLNLKRVQDNRKNLRQIIAHGLPVILNTTDEKIIGALTMEAIKQLDKIDGNEQLPRTNDADVDRRQRLYKEAVAELMQAGISDEQARAWVIENYPEAEKVM